MGLSVGGGGGGSGTATNLSLTGEARGAVAFRGATVWERLAPGTSGHMLRTNGAGADPSWAAAASAVTRRYDNSAAALRYLCDEAATPLVNTGSGGTLDLVQTGSAETYRCGGIFEQAGAIFFPTRAAGQHFAAANANVAPNAETGTIWAWFTPGAYGNHYQSIWGRTNSASDPILALFMGPNGAIEAQYFLAGAGGNNAIAVTTAGVLYHAQVPILVGVTYDFDVANTVKLYVNGLLANTVTGVTGALDSNKGTAPHWRIGNRPDAATDFSGVIQEVGYAATVYTHATFHTMWRNAWGWA